MKALRALAAASLLLSVLWSRASEAHPGFPGVIKTDLQVDITKIDPPIGCQLCHTDPNGATMTLTNFGELLVSKYGLPFSETEDDASLTAALTGLQMGDPKLIQDLQMGIDPNVDVNASQDPTPAYGCSTAPGRSNGAAAGVAILLGAVAWAAFARRSHPAPPTALTPRT